MNKSTTNREDHQEKASRKCRFKFSGLLKSFFTAPQMTISDWENLESKKSYRGQDDAKYFGSKRIQ